jgi:hypothetical protein
MVLLELLVDQLWVRVHPTDPPGELMIRIEQS